MKFYVTPYHFNLIKDKDRLAAFYEGIFDFYNDNKDVIDTGNNIDTANTSFNLKTAFDIGCGSGVLSYFASNYFDSVIAVDTDTKIIDSAKKSFDESKIDNVTFLNEDASLFNFKETANLVICEMLDTALIDEEQIPVLKNVKKYLKKDGKIIPQGIINIAEPVSMERDYIHYEDEEYHGKNPKYEILGNYVKFSEFDLLKDFEESFKTTIDFNFNNRHVDSNNNINSNSNSNSNFNSNLFNGIKITTFTKINENIICGPTPMLNPPLFIPVNPPKQINSKKISVELEYIMGGGVGTIKASII